jgi:hypothetical protein
MLMYSSRNSPLMESAPRPTHLRTPLSVRPRTRSPLAVTAGPPGPLAVPPPSVPPTVARAGPRLPWASASSRATSTASTEIRAPTHSSIHPSFPALPHVPPFFLRSLSSAAGYPQPSYGLYQHPYYMPAPVPTRRHAPLHLRKISTVSKYHTFITRGSRRTCPSPPSLSPPPYRLGHVKASLLHTLASSHS